MSDLISRHGSTAYAPHIVAGQHKLFIRSSDGLKWIVEPGSHDGFGPHHAEQEPYGNSVFDFIMASMPDGGTMLDIGAHVGCYALRAGRRGHVIAVEANPATSARLLENLALNNITTVTLLAMAAWNYRTIMHLAHGTSEEVRSGGMRVLEKDTGVGIDIPALPLDDVLLKYDRIDLVKIDTEGADIAIMKGLHRTIARCRPRVIIENHAYLGYYENDDLLAEIHSVPGYGWRTIKSFGVQAVAGDKGLNYWVGDPE